MKIKSLIFAGVLALAGAFGVEMATPGVAMAECKCPEGTLRANEGCKTYAECNLDKDEGDGKKLPNTLTTIVNVIIGVLGIVAVIIIVIGGITFVTSQGDAAKVTKAKNTVLYGVVGLVIAILAFPIVNFVLTAVFGGSGGA